MWSFAQTVLNIIVKSPILWWNIVHNEGDEKLLMKQSQHD